MESLIGPSVLIQTLSIPVHNDKRFPGNAWQYHSRSDRHSRVACWGLAVDLLITSSNLREKAISGELGFSVHHTMEDFRNYRKKSLDLVICRPAGEPTGQTLQDLADEWSLALTDAQRKTLESLPPLMEVPVGQVLVAMEAKACMTAHVKAKPRLYDELNSSHLTVHGASEAAIATGFVMINTAPRFVSSDKNKHDIATEGRVWSEHRADWAGQVVDKIQQLPRRARTQDVGFDAIAIVGVDCANDGESQVALEADEPMPQPGSSYHYESMVQRVSTLLAARFPML